ncbi:hypothetical protein SEPCBS119000_002494 [Sporothrix epigloea]|uniref:Uncharacterized protein n=1 Tax=Sporothrix epigloea TaxID=1892477 RepID=A0ABP0DKJ3_9PEZI
MDKVLAVVTGTAILTVGGLVYFVCMSQRKAKKQSVSINNVNDSNIDIERSRFRSFCSASRRSRSRHSRRGQPTQPNYQCSCCIQDEARQQSAEAYELNILNSGSRTGVDFEILPVYTKVAESSTVMYPAPAYTAHATV